MKAVEFVLGFLNLCQCEFAFKFKFGSETDPLRLPWEVNPLLAIKGCCNNIPGCVTVPCSVYDIHVQSYKLIFYNLFQ